MLTDPPNSRLSFSRFHRIRYILLRLQDFLSHFHFSFSLFLASTAKDHHRISSLLRHWGCFLPPLSCPLSLMESLQIAPSRIIGPRLPESTVFNSFSGIRQVGFASLLTRNGRDQSFCSRIRSFTEDRNAGGSINRSSDTARDKDGLLLGAQRDSSGSVVGFNLIPHSGKKWTIMRNLKSFPEMGFPPFVIRLIFACVYILD